jgi:cob(I)alamin adenosyltransferase
MMLTQVNDEVVRYLNRLSDLLWLFGRVLELRAGVNSGLRDQSARAIVDQEVGDAG